MVLPSAATPKYVTDLGAVLRTVKVDPITRDRLGRATLAEVRARLLAIDCQTCGKPFDASTPGPVVHRDGDRIAVTLHHRHCAEPRWVDQPAPPAAGPPTRTWRATGGRDLSRHGLGGFLIMGIGNLGLLFAGLAGVRWRNSAC